ncbi:MAG: hypothetical protein Q8941_16275 [Bacteroidota bacterium]|nr:hypothetical protein [Bacteroidota bacterium]
MKKIFFFHSVILLTFILSILLMSCSKEKTVLSPPAGAATVTVSAERLITQSWGSITGMILPLGSSVKIGISGTDFSSTEVYYIRDGRFRIDGIPPGIYKISITNLTTPLISDLTASPEYIIPSVKVGAGTLIDIGMIKLQ